MRSSLPLLIGGFALAMHLACTRSSSRPAFSGETFIEEEAHYEVQATKTGGFGGDDWRLVNYVESKDINGNPMLKPKHARGYTTVYSFDENNDGTADFKLERQVYDLEFEHKEHDGWMFLRSIPLSTDDGGRRLDVFLMRYLSALSSEGYRAEQFAGEVEITSRNHAAQVIKKWVSTWGERPSLTALIEVKNIDQLKMDPDAPGRKLLVTYAFSPRPLRQNTSAAFGSAANGRKLPLLLFAVYTNWDEHFAESTLDYFDFLDRVKIDGISGFRMPGTISVLAAAGAGGAPAVEAAPPAQPAEPTLTAPDEPATQARPNRKSDNNSGRTAPKAGQNRGAYGRGR
ncbi:MAG: hypothetical protein MK135_15720 [Polyangiaceae bacterium]|nr:hypothetical protein [Polyangiaceae bacterium]